MANATTSRLLAWEAGARLRTLQMTWLRGAECSDLSLPLPDVTTIAAEVGFAVDQANGIGASKSCGPRQQRSYSSATQRGKDNEDEDMDGDYQHGQTSRP